MDRMRGAPSTISPPEQTEPFSFRRTVFHSRPPQISHASVTRRFIDLPELPVQRKGGCDRLQPSRCANSWSDASTTQRGGRKGPLEGPASFDKAMTRAALTSIDLGAMKAIHDNPPLKQPTFTGRVTDPDKDPRTVVPCVPKCKAKNEERSTAYYDCFEARKPAEINRTQELFVQ